MLDLEYEDIDLEKWRDKDIVAVYRKLDAKINVESQYEPADLSKERRALRVIRVTAKNKLYQVGKKRDLARNLMDAFSQVVVIAANVALQML